MEREENHSWHGNGKEGENEECAYRELNPGDQLFPVAQKGYIPRHLGKLVS